MPRTTTAEFDADPIRHSIGVGAITNQIAEAENAIVIAHGGFQDGGERFEIAVEIAKNDVTQERLQAFRKRISVISGGAPMRAGMPMVPMPRVT